MDWILNHLQLLIAVAGGVAWWLNQRRLAGKGGGDEVRPEATFDDPELAERTRRIREEIKRKIEQRARGYAGEQPTMPWNGPADTPPVAREAAFRQPEPPPLTKAATVRQETERAAEILEQQAALAEQLKLAKEMKAAAQRRTEFEGRTSGKEEAAAAAVRSALGDDLRNPDSLRRAFVLREVLGPPVALR